MNPLRTLAQLGQSVYLDELGRGMLRTGDLARMIDEDGLHGVTSNPAIFEKSIAHTDHYDDAIADLAKGGIDVVELYETLVIEDIQNAADLFRERYRTSDGHHGYVSLEVAPDLADDTEGTVAEARRLWQRLDRPNVFIKVPGTEAGLAAIEQLTAEGVNLNVTLLFGLGRYTDVAEAYLKGLEARVERGEPLGSIASVASFFLSRIDVAIDPELDRLAAAGGAQGERAKALRGTAAIASAKGAWQRYQQAFGGERFARLAALGARPQWLLWASTGTKDPAYPATMYVEPLIGADTVTTLPRETLDAYRAQGEPALRLDDDLDAAAAQLDALADLGIDLDAVTATLEREGVAKFVQPFDALMEALREAVAKARV
ncbi:MAG: transaldolase [Trueperaceae bacterium]